LTSILAITYLVDWYSEEIVADRKRKPTFLENV